MGEGWKNWKREGKRRGDKWREEGDKVSTTMRTNVCEANHTQRDRKRYARVKYSLQRASCTQLRGVNYSVTGIQHAHHQH